MDTLEYLKTHTDWADKVNNNQPNTFRFRFMGRMFVESVATDAEANNLLNSLMVNILKEERMETI